MSESFLRIMGRGQASTTAITSMAQACRDYLVGLSFNDLSTVLRFTLEEIVILCNALLALLGHPVEGDPVTEMNSKSSLSLVKRFITQNSFWRLMEKKYRQSSVAVATLMPEIGKFRDELCKDEVDISQCQRFAKRIRVWDEALPAGSSPCTGNPEKPIQTSEQRGSPCQICNIACVMSFPA